jgi:membrane protease YdiL (CAAX protease family)
VHVAVVEVPGASTDYARTKREGERVARQSDLDVTILRPALVVGPGDDALRHTIRLVRLAAVFPVPRPNPGRLAVVDVRDVAAAVVATLERPASIGGTYDVVGPERLTLGQLAGRVARALSLPTWCPAIPAAPMRLLAAVVERLGPLAIVTRSQLDMLVRGLDGDGDPAARDLGLRPRAIDEARIRQLASARPGPSLRLAPDATHRELLDRASAASSTLRWFLPLAIVAMLALPLLWPNVWLRMTAVEVTMAALALLAVPLPWRALARPGVRTIGVGLMAAAGLYAACGLGFFALRWLAPGVAAQAGTMLGWTAQLPLSVQLPLLVVVVIGEDIVWRAAIGLPLCARAGPLAGCLLSGAAFAVAHVTSGPPLLWLAALGCGAFWTALLLRTRSLVATIVCHGVWDLAVIYVAPYV